MTNPSRFFLHLVALTGLTGFLWSAPAPIYGTVPVLAADAPSVEVDPESGKRPGEAGSESDETRAYTGRTNLPLPRYASLRADEVNLRTGPGVRYPIDWVFQRRGLPVEITAEFENWRKVRDGQGTEGWVHRQMLSGKRSLIVVGKEEVMRRQAESDSPAVARLAPGVVVQVLECTGDWCRVEASGFRGWLQRSGTWGSLPDERIK
jgi:SH3-like domain-containing protein